MRVNCRMVVSDFGWKFRISETRRGERAVATNVRKGALLTAGLLPLAKRDGNLGRYARVVFQQGDVCLERRAARLFGPCATKETASVRVPPTCSLFGFGQRCSDRRFELFPGDFKFFRHRNSHQQGAFDPQCLLRAKDFRDLGRRVDREHRLASHCGANRKPATRRN